MLHSQNCSFVVTVNFRSSHQSDLCLDVSPTFLLRCVQDLYRAWRSFAVTSVYSRSAIWLRLAIEPKTRCHCSHQSITSMILRRFANMIRNWYVFVILLFVLCYVKFCFCVTCPNVAILCSVCTDPFSQATKSFCSQKQNSLDFFPITCSPC